MKPGSALLLCDFHKSASRTLTSPELILCSLPSSPVSSSSVFRSQASRLLALYSFFTSAVSYFDCTVCQLLNSLGFRCSGFQWKRCWLWAFKDLLSETASVMSASGLFCSVIDSSRLEKVFSGYPSDCRFGLELLICSNISALIVRIWSFSCLIFCSVSGSGFSWYWIR